MNSAPNADELADRLDQALPPHVQTVPDRAADDPRVTAALRLARGPHPALDVSAVARIQAQMLARADGVSFAVRSARRPAARVLRWAVAACLVVALLVVGTASASAQSLPGETLYPVKRLVERGRLALSSEDGDVSLRLDFAALRLDEFETLLDQGTVNLQPLDDATQDLSAALGLVEHGAGSRSTAAARLVELSERNLALVRRTLPGIEQDQAKADHLRTITAQVEHVEQQARGLASPTAGPSTYTPLNRHARHGATLVYIPHDLSLLQGSPAGSESMVFIDSTTPTPAPPSIDEAHVSLANPSGDSRNDPPAPTAEETVTPEPTDDGRGTLGDSTPTPTDLPPTDLPPDAGGTPGDTPTPDPGTPTEPPAAPEFTATPEVTEEPEDRGTLDEGTPTPTDLPLDDGGTPGDTPTPDPGTPTEPPATPEPPMPDATAEPGESVTLDESTPAPGDLLPADDAASTPDAGTADAILPTPVPTDPLPGELSTPLPGTPPDLPPQP